MGFERARENRGRTGRTAETLQQSAVAGACLEHVQGLEERAGCHDRRGYCREICAMGVALHVCGGGGGGSGGGAVGAGAGNVGVGDNSLFGDAISL